MGRGEWMSLSDIPPHLAQIVAKEGKVTVIRMKKHDGSDSNGPSGFNNEDVVVHEINKSSTSNQVSKKDNHRLHLLLPEKAVDAIAILQDRLEASTTSEAVRRSLFLALKVTESIKDGGSVIIEKPDGTRQTILIG